MALRTPARRQPTTVHRLLATAEALTAAQQELKDIDLRTTRGELRTLVRNSRVEVAAALDNVNKALPEAVRQTKTPTA